MSKLLRWWFVRNHGEGAVHQADVFRCHDCGKLRTWNHVVVGNLCCSGRLIPVNPTFFEAFRLLVLPWTV